MSAVQPKLVYADGSAVTRAHVNAVRNKASLTDGNPSPWAYDAGSMYSREVGDWNMFVRSPDNEINLDQERIRARSRDLDRNDGWASGTTTRKADALVGSNFHVVPMPNWRALRRVAGPAFDASWAAEFRTAVMAEWRMIMEDPLFYCDATRSMSGTQLFYQAVRHKLVDGEALGMPLWLPERMGYGAARYATALRMVDPDRLSNPNLGVDTHSLRGGVELNENMAPVAYHIRRAHQNDYYDAALSMIWDRFERQTAWGRPLVVHDFDRNRADQHRGLGIFTSVLPLFRMLAKHGQVSLQAALMRTVYGFFIKSPMDAEQLREAMETSDDQQEMKLSGYQMMRRNLGDQDLNMNGVKMPVLPPGDDIVNVQTNGHADDFDAFQHSYLRNAAAGTDQSASDISKDFSKLNYSSYRGEMLGVWRGVLRARSTFATGFCTPIYVAYLEEMLARKYVPLPKDAPDFIAMRPAYSRCEWIGPGRGWVDPVKERQGEVLGLDAGFGTLRNTCADISGVWWQDAIDERVVEEQYMKARGMTLPDWAGGQLVQASLMDEKPAPQ